jgi:hypothetical protein
VKKVLLLGGYGTFGRRIAPRLVEAGFEVLVAGRSRTKAEAFCAGRPGLIPLVLDRDLGLAHVLAAHRPFALVDAAGPFQGMTYSVARAAIAAGCHYLDIADARDFVCGIHSLDAEARAAGVIVIAGASTVPALSGAVARRLADGMDQVRAVEMTLSATSLGTSGRSITRVALSYLGRPIALWRNRRWSVGYGAQELKRQDFEATGARPLRGRLAGLADVPDLALLPDRLPRRPAVIFRAGTDLDLHNLGLWLLSWPVRWRWVGIPASAQALVSGVQRLTAWAGSHRSAMTIRLFGKTGPRRLERRWTLIADKDDGPHIPTLAVPILLGKLAEGAIAHGARDGGTLLELEDFAPSFAGLAVVQETVEIEQPGPLYERVMGGLYSALPKAVRALHDVLRDGGAHGRATVTRGGNFAARLIAGLLGFPEEGEHDLHVGFTERDGRETWTRDFSGRRFSSILYEKDGLLIERFGATAFGFDLPGGENGLDMVLRRWWLGPLPMPMMLAPRAPAREWEDEEGRFRFDVRIGLPLIGLVVHYRGWLRQGE